MSIAIFVALSLVASLLFLVVVVGNKQKKITDLQIENARLLRDLHSHVNRGEHAGQMLRNQHIYCFEALQSSTYFDFVCSLSNQEQLTSDKSQISERQLMSELWDTGYCTMCDRVHVTDVVDVGLLKIYKVIYVNWNVNDKPTYEHWVARGIGVRVRKNSEVFERLAENLDKHFGGKS